MIKLSEITNDEELTLIKSLNGINTEDHFVYSFALDSYERGLKYKETKTLAVKGKHILAVVKYRVVEDELTLSAIYTLPTARNLGLAKYLLREVVEIFNKNNLKSFKIFIDSNARNFYTKCGFDLRDEDLVYNERGSGWQIYLTAESLNKLKLK